MARIRHVFPRETVAHYWAHGVQGSARVFDRIVNAGGKAWPDGAGPMVGHYRVNSIGADGALVIGCHEFNPDEARRLRDLLAQCAECQAVTVADGETV